MGLSAAELPTETLFPGDTVEYFSMAFVAGDKRGHRVAKVLRVDRSDEEFPIRLDTQEVIPLTLMLKRNLDRNGFEISSTVAKWRKLRTFKLVDGEVEGETRADRLNAGIKKGIADAMMSTKKMLANAKTERAQAGSKKLMSSFFTKLQPHTATADDSDADSHRSVTNRASWDHKRGDRKPLAVRDNENPAHKTKTRVDSSPKKKKKKKKHAEATYRPSEPRPRKQELDPLETRKSLKRKRVGQSPQKLRRQERTREEKSVSKISSYFTKERASPQSKKRAKQNLSLFVNQVEEKPDLNTHLAHEKAKKERKERAKGEAKAERVRPAQSEKRQRRERHRQGETEGGCKTQKTLMDTWEIPRKKPQANALEQGSQLKGRTFEGPEAENRHHMLNLAAPGGANSSARHRKGLDFMMNARPGDARSSRDHDHKSRGFMESRDFKKRSSLGTMSATAVTRASSMRRPACWPNG